MEAVPVAALDDVLWLEADRMKTLAFSTKTLENQRNVVKEEVRSNVLNKPYGLFYAIDLPGKAYDRFPNNHNFYGDFHDLDTATVSDVRNFYDKYYAPNNAVVVIVGDVNAKEIFAKAEKYFGGIPRRDVPPHPDVSERRSRVNGAPSSKILWRSYLPMQLAIECPRMVHTPQSLPRWQARCCTMEKLLCSTRLW